MDTMYDDRFAKGRGRRTRNVEFMRDHWIYFDDNAPLGDKSQTEWLLDADAFLLEQSGLIDGVEYNYNSDGEFEWLGLSQEESAAYTTDWDYGMSTGYDRRLAQQAWKDWRETHTEKGKKKRRERERVKKAERQAVIEAKQLKASDEHLLKLQEAAAKREEQRQLAEQLRAAEAFNRERQAQADAAEYESVSRLSTFQQLAWFLKRDPTDFELGFFQLTYAYGEICLSFRIALSDGTYERLVSFSGERNCFNTHREFLDFLFKGVVCKLTTSHKQYGNVARVGFNDSQSIDVLTNDLMALRTVVTAAKANDILWRIAAIDLNLDRTFMFDRVLPYLSRTYRVTHVFSRTTVNTRKLDEYPDGFKLLLD